jgi:hypothetical protein
VILRALLKEHGIDPNALLRAEVGGPLKDGGGITLRLEDGVIDIHIIVPQNALPREKK